MSGLIVYPLSHIIAVDLTAVEAFLGRIGDPKPAPGAARPETAGGLRAIMFTDVVGPTEMTARLGDAAAFNIVRVHDGLVRRGLAAHSRREVKHTGDGIMAAFDEMADAVQAATDIQRHVLAHSRGAAKKLRVRIGIHAGEPIADHDAPTRGGSPRANLSPQLVPVSIPSAGARSAGDAGIAGGTSVSAVGSSAAAGSGIAERRAVVLHRDTLV